MKENRDTEEDLEGDLSKEVFLVCLHVVMEDISTNI